MPSRADLRIGSVGGDVAVDRVRGSCVLHSVGGNLAAAGGNPGQTLPQADDERATLLRLLAQGRIDGSQADALMVALGEGL